MVVVRIARGNGICNDILLRRAMLNVECRMACWLNTYCTYAVSRGSEQQPKVMHGDHELQNRPAAGTIP